MVGPLARALALLLALAAPAAAAPARVVSINLCTDQYAMLLADPGQLVSISHVARDPGSSAMAAEAARWPVNSGMAEEVFGLAPDLVLAGTFTTRATVGLLRRLGVPVVEIQPETSLDSIPTSLRRVGAALGQTARAEAMAAAFEAELAALRAAGASQPRPTAALHYANGYTSGAGTLADSVVAAAGFDNAATRRGLSGLVRMPLETLVMATPDLVIQGSRYDPPSLAEAVLDHPALAAATADAAQAAVSDSRWVCGGPFTLDAVRALAAIRDRLAAR